MGSPQDPSVFIGQRLKVQIDRPMGSMHPEHGFIYPVNYGFIPGVTSGDGEELDAYVLGIFEPIEEFTGICIAYLARSDGDHKLIVVPEGTTFDDARIGALTEFQERWFDSNIVRESAHAGEPRRSARLVIIDGHGRLLLFRYHDEHQEPFWSTAGGELKAGEDYLAAAERELLEETGFEASIGPLLRTRDETFAIARSGPSRWIEHYFLVEVEEEIPDTSHWTEEERTTIKAWHWWTAEEMATSQERFLPEWLPALLDEALIATQW